MTNQPQTKAAKTLSADLQQYLVVIGNYWAFTLTDGALRMLIVLHFYQLGVYTTGHCFVVFVLRIFWRGNQFGRRLVRCEAWFE